MTVCVVGVTLPNEKSQPPLTVKRSGLVEPSTGSVTLTNNGPAQEMALIGIVAVKVVGFTNVVASVAPLKLISDWAVKLLPVAVSRNDAAPAVAETGFNEVKEIIVDAVGSLIFQAPRP